MVFVGCVQYVVVAVGGDLTPFLQIFSAHGVGSNTEFLWEGVYIAEPSVFSSDILVVYP